MGCVGGQALANRRLFCVFSLLKGQNVKVKPKILIADDSVMNQQMLTEILGDSYEYLYADNGLQALEVLNELHRIFDVARLVDPLTSLLNRRSFDCAKTGAWTGGGHFFMDGDRTGRGPRQYPLCGKPPGQVRCTAPGGYDGCH